MTKRPSDRRQPRVEETKRKLSETENTLQEAIDRLDKAHAAAHQAAAARANLIAAHDARLTGRAHTGPTADDLHRAAIEEQQTAHDIQVVERLVREAEEKIVSAERDADDATAEAWSEIAQAAFEELVVALMERGNIAWRAEMASGCSIHFAGLILRAANEAEHRLTLAGDGNILHAPLPEAYPLSELPHRSGLMDFSTREAALRRIKATA